MKNSMREWRRTTSTCAAALTALLLFAPAAAADITPEQAVHAALLRAKKVGTVSGVESKVTSFGRAQASMDPESSAGQGITPPPSSPVDLVTVRGSFVDYMAKLPRGASAPTGTEMSFIVDPETGSVEAIHVGGKPVGAVGVTAAAPAATTASRKHRAVARAASWGREGCSQVRHCYSIAEWYMTGGEKVEGTLDIEDTTAMNVPGWASGDFVDDEGWTDFLSSGYWVEAGNTAGEYFDCCGIHPFFAHQNHSGYYQYVAPWTTTGNYGGPPGEPYYQMYGPGPTWSTYWWGNLVNQEGGFSTYSNDLQVGMEIAANTKPANAASIADDATWTDGSVHNWNKAAWYAEPGTCIGKNGKSPATGNVTVGTC
jgi:hypothetical protein